VFDLANPSHLAALRARLSVDRLAPYDVVSGGSPATSLRLYEWNTAVSAACYATLQAVEVVLRNALHDQLAGWHAARGLGGSWYDDPRRVLDPRGHADIAKARDRVRRSGRPETPGRVVAELPFGFWRYLLAARYEQTLWTPALRHAFPHLQPRRRRSIAEPIERLHQLRNRIAHHEPIHHRNLSADHGDMLVIVSAICPYTRSWVDRNSTVPMAMAKRPK
jgi:hypothetical protein